jgi:hypothetical protein
VTPHERKERAVKRILAGLAIGLGGLLGVAGPVAAATGSQSFTIVDDNNAGTVIASGAISGVGQDIETSDTTDQFVFPQGTLTVDHPTTSENDTFDPVTCIGRATFSGTYTFTGSGGLAGATGAGTYSGRAFFIGDRNPDGTCSEESGTSFVVVHATGTATTP